MWRSQCLAAALASSISVDAAAMANGEDEEMSPYLGKSCDITQRNHAAARAPWMHLASRVVQGADGVEELHAVYAQSSSIDFCRATGRLPEGTVLITEVRKAVTDAPTTGRAKPSDRIVFWFVMIKDSQGHVAPNSIRAEDWGGVLFVAEDPASDTATNFQDDHMPGHEPAQQSARLRYEKYPVFRD